MSAPVLDFWFDFASTYSYPAAMRIRALAREAAVAVKFRPFLLGPIFKSQGWPTSPFNLYPEKGRHMWRDLERICTDMALPFRKPEPFPQNSLLAARVALVGLDEAANMTWGEQFCLDVFRAQFGEGRQIGEVVTLKGILLGLNVAAEAVLAAAQSDANKARLRSQTEDAQRRGLFGAPIFTTADGELFWGNDRLERALLWATQNH
jgi:2-hydroxychromene-2-carboxylate isomerase